MSKTKKFVYCKRFEGLPKVTDFQLVQEDLPELQDGDILTEALYLSVDPHMRTYMDGFPLGITMLGDQVARVLESKNPAFPKDAIFCGTLGWRTHSVFNPKDITDWLSPYVLPFFGNLPLSLGVGQLGMPGNTAYFGFLDICQPKKGEMVVVSGAAGAVGSLVGQIAKIMECKVIGIAGTDDKCEWLTKEIGFDHAINYKTQSIAEELKKFAPDGVDCYFDNVGGETSSIVLSQMRLFGRISVCGSTSSYNLPMHEWPKVPTYQHFLITNQISMQGFLFTRFLPKWFDGIAQMKLWIEQGKLKYRQTITEGFEKMPQALIDMLEGKNYGKAVVKVQYGRISRRSQEKQEKLHENDDEALF